MCAYTTGARILGTKPPRRVFPCYLFVYVTSHLVGVGFHSSTSHRIASGWLGTCDRRLTAARKREIQLHESKMTIQSRVTYKRRAAMERSPNTSDALIVRRALRSTKKRAISRLNLSATRRDLTDAYATRRPSSFARGAVLRKGLHGDSLQREKARN